MASFAEGILEVSTKKTKTSSMTMAWRSLRRPIRIIPVIPMVLLVQRILLQRLERQVVGPLRYLLLPTTTATRTTTTTTPKTRITAQRIAMTNRIHHLLLPGPLRATLCSLVPVSHRWTRHTIPTIDRNGVLVPNQKNPRWQS